MTTSVRYRPPSTAIYAILLEQAGRQLCFRLTTSDAHRIVSSDSGNCGLSGDDALKFLHRMAARRFIKLSTTACAAYAPFNERRRLIDLALVRGDWVWTRLGRSAKDLLTDYFSTHEEQE